MKIWQKGKFEHNDTTRMVEQFTVGNDREWDLLLAKYDVLGSLAHAEMLQKVGIINAEEWQALQKGLMDILAEVEAGAFTIADDAEDVHSQVEALLTQRIGDAGKKLHTGRSRNDQVLTDIKLYLKHGLSEVAGLVNQLFERLQALSEQHKNTLLPGYTHLQLAMPSSFGLWFGAYAESLVDDMELLVAAYHIADKNPLGSGAGFGSAFPLDRQLTTDLMGFSQLNYNSVYAQMSRGKTEKAALTAFASIAGTLSRFAYDVCLYLGQQLRYLSFPESLTTGSSIMPHKKNPDVFELIRAKCNRLQAAPNEMTLLCSNLPSGYHRDMQLTKDILFPAVASIKECLSVAHFALQDVKVREDILDSKQFDELFSVEEINKLVLQGLSFREAYIQVGQSFNKGEFNPSHNVQHTHMGSIGNLCNAEIKQMMERLLMQMVDVK